jgi:hypothetical protein
MRAVTRGAAHIRTPQEVFPRVTAINPLGASKAIQPPSAGHPAQARHTPPVLRRATFVYNFPQLNPAAPPAQEASLPLPSLLLPVVSLRRRGITAIRAGLPLRVRRQLFRVILSKTNVTLGSWRSIKTGVGSYLLRNCKAHS